MDLSYKTILITGATDGIGKALAIEFSKLGSNIILLGKDSSKLDKVYDQLDHSYQSQKHLILQADLSLLNNESAQEILRVIAEEFISLDGIIHNAAILGTLGPIHHHIKVNTRIIHTCVTHYITSNNAYRFIRLSYNFTNLISNFQIFQIAY